MTIGKFRFLAAITSRAQTATRTSRKPTSSASASADATMAETRTARRAATHRLVSVASRAPAIGSRPVQFGGHQKAGDDGAQIAEQHLMPVPGERIERRRQRHGTGPRADPQPHDD